MSMYKVQVKASSYGAYSPEMPVNGGIQDALGKRDILQVINNTTWGNMVAEHRKAVEARAGFTVYALVDRVAPGVTVLLTLPGRSKRKR